MIETAPYAGEAGIWCHGEEALLITSFSGDGDARVRITGRFIDPTRRTPVSLELSHVPNTDRTPATQEIALGEGWLTGLSAIASSGTPGYAHTFLRVDLIRGRGASATVLQTLMQGPVTALTRRAWPGSPISAAIEGPGLLRSITGTNPAAGASVSETVPAGARWKLLALLLTLVTDATAANREVAIVLDDGTTAYLRVPSGVAQTASLTRRYAAAADVFVSAVAQDGTIRMPIPTLTLPAGHRITTVTTNLQAGDDYGAPQLLVEEWLEAA